LEPDGHNKAGQAIRPGVHDQDSFLAQGTGCARPFSFLSWEAMAVGEKAWRLPARSDVPASRGRIIGLLAALIFLGLAAGLVVLYRSTQIPITLTVDGQVRSVRTHQTTVGAVLRENCIPRTSPAPNSRNTCRPTH